MFFYTREDFNSFHRNISAEGISDETETPMHGGWPTDTHTHRVVNIIYALVWCVRVCVHKSKPQRAINVYVCLDRPTNFPRKSSAAGVENVKKVWMCIRQNRPLLPKESR